MTVLPAAAGLILGILVVQIGLMLSVAHASSIALPGIPIKDTEFSPTIGDKTDPLVISGSWTVASMDPYRLTLSLPNKTISKESARTIADGFLDERLKNYVAPADDLDVYTPTPILIPEYLKPAIWQFFFANRTWVNGTQYQTNLALFVYVSGLSAEVVGYDEYWYPGWNPPDDIGDLAPQRLGTAIEVATAQEAAVAFLLEHNYTLPSTARYIRSVLAVRYDDEHVNQADIYEVILRIPTGTVFPDRGADGITIQVDAYNGRVTRFLYLLPILPEIDIDALRIMTSEVAYRLEVGSVPVSSFDQTATLENTYLRLVSATVPESNVFALAWSFEFLTSVNGFNRFGEFGSHDAVSGQYLYPGFYWQQNLPVAAAVMPLSVVLVSAMIATTTRMLWLRSRKR
jgi:hypothetical protein